MATLRVLVSLAVLLVVPLSAYLVTEFAYPSLPRPVVPGQIMGACEIFLGPDHGCTEPDLREQLARLSRVGLAAVGGALAIIVGAALFCGASRSLNARVFPAMQRIVLLLMLAILTSQAAILVVAYAMAISHPEIGPRPGIFIAGTAGIGMSVVFTMMATAFGLPKRELRVPGVVLPERGTMARIVAELADQLDAPRPTTIIGGLEPHVWMVSGRVAIEGRNQVELDGRTLHLPLSLMDRLDVEELAGLIAAELAHYRGRRETYYADTFLPVYAPVADTRFRRPRAGPKMNVGGLYTRVLGPILRFPAEALLRILVSAFAVNRARISRKRARAADTLAARIAGAEVYAGALLTQALAVKAWPAVVEEERTRLEAGLEPATSLGQRLGDRLTLGLAPGEIEGLRRRALAESIPHPTEARPPTRRRLRRLKVKPADLPAEALRATPKVSARDEIMPELDNFETALSQKISDRLVPPHRRSRALGRDRDAPFYEALYGVLAPLVMAGPEPSERFARAAKIGVREMTQFDPVRLAAVCMGRTRAPVGIEAADRLARAMPAEARPLALRYLSRVVGAASKEDRALLEAVADRLAPAEAA